MDHIVTIQVICSPTVASLLEETLAKSDKVTIVPDAIYPGFEVPIHKTGRDRWWPKQKESHHD